MYSLASLSIIVILGVLIFGQTKVNLDSFPIPLKGESIEIQNSSYKSPGILPKQGDAKGAGIYSKITKDTYNRRPTSEIYCCQLLPKNLHPNHNRLCQGFTTLSQKGSKQHLTSNITKTNHLHNFNLLQPKTLKPHSLSNVQPIHFNFLSDDPVCATFGNGRWRLYASALLSPDLVFRKLESKNSESDSYVQTRETTESQRLSYSAGLNITAVSGFGLSIRTGLNYSQINERFDYVNEREETIDYYK